jgi:hypothetical protein
MEVLSAAVGHSICLEMITRDPLKVPYLDDKYWAVEKRDTQGSKIKVGLVKAWLSHCRSAV